MFLSKKIINFTVRDIDEVRKHLIEAQIGVHGSAKKKYTPSELEEISSEFLFTKIIEDIKKENKEFAAGTVLPNFFKEIESIFGKEQTSSSTNLVNYINAELKKRGVPNRVKKGITPKRFALIIQ